MRRFFGCLCLVIALAFLAACSGNSIEAPDFDFEIVSIQDQSTQGMRRYWYRVAVSHEATPSEIEHLARYIVELVKADKDFNALQIWFFDFAEFAMPGRSHHTLGEAIYAPGGAWARASEVVAGDYRTFDFSFTLPEKDWSLRLTPEEAAIFGYWREIQEVAGFSEPVINSMVANEFEITIEEVENILLRQLVWAHNRIRGD